MKKLFVFILALAFVFTMVSASEVYAGPSGPAYGNAIWAGGSGTDKTQPPMEYIRVRYGMCSPNSPALPSGCVVSWDIASADGVTISACVGRATVGGGIPYIAGVLVTDILTDDNTTSDPSDRSYGYMAIRGYCLACMDVSQATAGYPLIPTDAALQPAGMLGTLNVVVGGALSCDIGVALAVPAADGPAPVILAD